MLNGGGTGVNTDAIEMEIGHALADLHRHGVEDVLVGVGQPNVEALLLRGAIGEGECGAVARGNAGADLIVGGA